MGCFMNSKFTLIELLVVISIIGILSSILLPSLVKARKASQAAVCVNNLKQTGVLSEMYVSDGNDRYMYGTQTQTNAWFLQFQEEMDIGLLQCPAANNYYPGPEAERTFGMNAKMLGRKTGEVTDTVQTLLIADGSNYDQGDSLTSPYYYWELNSSGTRMHKVRDLIHRKKANTLMADGHVDNKGQSFLATESIFWDPLFNN